ncbi:MAG TPA: UbiA family prenyltransferase [Phycisphaerae bacterium]|nr:UbiA family prenyltransferase [Phycisphaerae bacterium]
MTHALPQHPARPSRLAAWGQLFRLPNLLTVPGDPVAGFLLASMAVGGGMGMAIIPAAAASALLYAAGLVANDLFDLRIDRRERPGRPLPSGRIKPATAGIVLAVLTPLGVGCALLAGPAAGVVALALTASIFLYDGLTKRIRPAAPGAVNMGLCRGLSLLLGAAAAGGLGSWPVAGSAVGLTAYIAAVTWIAAGETRTGTVGLKRFAPLIVLAGWLGFVLVPSSAGGRLESMMQALPAIPAFCALALTAWSALRLRRRPAPATVQRAVGGLIGALLPIQATLCATASTSGLIAAAVLMAAWPVFRTLSRRFYPS